MSRTGDDATDVSSVILRAWRQMSRVLTNEELKSAYLQLHIAKKPWKYQQLKYKGKTYCLTRLGFGLCSAPRIMTKILSTVFSKGEGIIAATNSYMNDILVDEMRVAALIVFEHLEQYGLLRKQPEPLGGGSVALGLRLEMSKNGELMFRRGNEVPEVKENLSRRMVRHCSRCQSIDPAPATHKAGKVSMKNDWRRLANDVTHHRQEL